MRVAPGAGRTVVVTGANSGIGLATAVAAARAGFGVVATVRSEAKAQPLHVAAEAAGVAVETAFLEVTDADACRGLIDRVRPFGLVNNAGVNAVAAVEDATDTEAREIVEINTIAPMRLARLAVPFMREQGGGRIVNVSSTEGRVVLPSLCWYQASKHALGAATATLRLEVARDGIHVCTVEPGGVDTAIYEKGFWVDDAAHSGSQYAATYGRLKRLIGANRFELPPDAVAAVIVGALVADRPRPRYLVGADARALVATHNLLPTRGRERLHRKVFAL